MSAASSYIPAPNHIVVAAVVFLDDNGRVLTVRKRGTSRFMLPGGKPEVGEAAIDTAIREVREEIGVTLDAETLEPLGTFTAAAANESGHTVTGTIFVHPDSPEIAAFQRLQPAAEIEELRWTDPDGALDDVAPLLATQIFPALERGRGA